MDGFIKWLGKTGLTAIIWVFILSITWNGRTMFSYANELLIQNSLVRTLDSKLAEMWDNVTDTANATMNGEKTKEKI